MSEWIAFKYIENDEIRKCSVRTYEINEVEEISSNTCKVFVDDHDHYWVAAEPYEDVMRKIQKAEAPVAVPVAEHFTSNEYDFIEGAVEYYKRAHEKTKAVGVMADDIIDIIEGIKKGAE